MTCPKCGSDNVSVQIVTETKIKQKKHGIFWWIFVGFWWVPIKWLFFTLPALIIKIFKPKKYKIKTTNTKTAVCNNCGNSWECD